MSSAAAFPLPVNEEVPFVAENVVKNKIVIEGEAKYKQTLREISQQLREAKSEVKAASAEMKAQGQSTESARAKLDALNHVYKAQTEQLSQMREHLGKVADAYGENSREASELRTKINNLRAETAGTSSQMQDLERQLDNAGDAAQGMKDDLSGLDGDMAKLGDSAGDAAGELEGLPGILSGLGEGINIGVGVSLGKDMLGGIKGAIKKAVTMGFQEAVEDQQGYNRVGIQTGTLGMVENDMLFDAMELLQLRRPQISQEDAVNYAASVWTRAAGTDYLGDAKGIADLMDVVYANSQRAQIGFDEVAEAAKNMSAVFGSDFKDNVELIGSIGQTNAGSKGVDTIEKYGMSFRDLGMNVEEAAGAVTHASDTGIDDVGKYGKAVESLATWMHGLSDETEGVKELGLLGTDLGNKFEHDAETAAKAVALVIEQLRGIKDVDLQNKLGSDIFGSQAWDRYGINIADAVMQGYGKEIQEEAHRQSELTMQTMNHDFGSQWKISGNVAKEAAGEFITPVVDAWTNVFEQANNKAIETVENGGSPIQALGTLITSMPGAYYDNIFAPAMQTVLEEASGMAETFGEVLTSTPIAMDPEAAAAAVEQMETLNAPLEEAARQAHEKLEEALTGGDTGLAETYYEQEQALLQQVADNNLEIIQTAGTQVDEALSQQAAGVAESVEASTQEKLDAVVDKIRNLNDLIAAAYDAGDPGLAESVKTERDAAIQEMNTLQSQLQEEAKTAGGNVDSGFSAGAANVEVTVEDTATGMITKLQDKAQNFLDQGNAFGVNLDEGFLTGAEPTPGDAADTVDSVIGNLEDGIGRAYNAGHATGAAYNRGYKNALDQHSPSRVMRAAAEDTISPILDTMEDGEDEVHQRAYALGEAVSGGYAEGTGNRAVLAAGGFAAGGGTVDPAALAEAVRAGLGGLAVVIDGQLAGYLLEPDVSRATSQRAVGTVKGQSAGARSW